MKTYSNKFGNIFYRINDNGNADILYTEDGADVCSMDENVYPIDSDVSARYAHPEGLELSIEDAMSLGIPHEDEPARRYKAEQRR